jgi:hypothetical protein
VNAIRSPVIKIGFSVSPSSTLRLGFETMFGQFRERFNAPVYHIAETMWQMIAVSSMYDYALYAVSMVFAGSGTTAMVFSRMLDFFQESVLQLACLFCLPLLKQRHRFHLQSVVIYHKPIILMCSIIHIMAS